jgi:phage terminase small subunit
VALNSKQQAFAREYCVDRNATQAAIRAGYSLKTAGQIAHKLLKIAEIQALVDAQAVKVAERIELTAAGVLQDLVRLAQKAEDTGELATALKGRELLGKHLKLFTDKVEVSGKLTLAELVEAAAKPEGS